MNRDELQAANCWFSVDYCPGDPETTEWKRRARLHQARWRYKHGYPAGTQPYRPRSAWVTVGSRLPVEWAEATGANFLTDTIRAAVRRRVDNPEDHQTLRTERLYADLLSSMPMCFNLFGDLNVGQGPGPDASRAVRRWWPDAPAGEVVLCFEFSPGRLDSEYLNNRSAFDAAFCITRDDGSKAIIGVETKYHEHPKREPVPGANRLPRYIQVTERSNAFVPDWQQRILGTHLQQIWLDHLLVLAMLQHPSHKWSWGRFVLVYPLANPAFARLASEYAEALRDASTYEPRTIESLLDTPGALDSETIAAFRERYLAVERPWDPPSGCRAPVVE